MRTKTNCTQEVTLATGSTDELEEEFTYITGSNDQDVESRLGKARSVFEATNKLWKSKIIGRTMKVKVFTSNVNAVLLYATESWTIIERKTERLQRFSLINVYEGL